MKNYLILFITIFSLNLSAQKWQDNIDAGGNYVNGDFMRVKFIDQNTGFIVGRNGGHYRASMLKTNDGGKSWRNIQININGSINSIQFLDEKTGYISASSNPVAGNTNYILKTIDTGNSWSVINTNSGAYITDVQFYSTNIGFMTTARDIQKTTDGGQSWSKISTIDTFYNQLAFLNDTILVASGYNLLRSTDMGATWTGIRSLGNYYLIKFIDSIGFCLGNGALRTSDHGKTWTNMTGFLLTAWDIDMKNNIVIAAGDRYIYRSTDYGKTFTNIMNIENSQFRGVAFAKEGVFVVGDSVIYQSKDDGLTWSKNIIGRNTLSHKVKYNSTGNAYMISGNAVLKSSDKGKNWSRLKSNFSNWNYGLATVGSNKIITCGDLGAINLSQDNGQTWTKPSSGTGQVLFDIYFVDDNLGYIVGDVGIILKTINGGTTWTKQTSNTTKYLNSIYMFANQVGWTVGDNGAILTTTDGGTTWAVKTITLAHCNMVTFTSANNGYIVGANGLYFETKDAGVNWTLKNINTTKKLNGIKFLNQNEGWIYGDSSLLLHTTDGGSNWVDESLKSNNGIWGLDVIDSVTGVLCGEYGFINILYCDVSMPLGKDTQSFNTGEKISNLVISGSSLQWYDNISAGNKLTTATALVDKTFYYVSQKSGKCESARKKVYAIKKGTVGIADNDFNYSIEYIQDRIIIHKKQVNLLIEIYNLSGVLVYKDESNLGTISIDISSFNRGLYLIKIGHEHYSSIDKIMIE